MELYHLHLSRQAASPETFVYTLMSLLFAVCHPVCVQQ
jgi:hypothetical protein